MFGELHGRRADGARRAVDEDALAGLDVRLAQAMHCKQSAVEQRRGFFIVQILRLDRQCGLVGPAHFLGVRADLPRAHAEQLIARLEPRHVAADGLDIAGEYHSENAPRRGAFQRLQARAEENPDSAVGTRRLAHEPKSTEAHGCRDDANAELVPPRHRSRDVSELQDLGRAVARYR